jgi:hypothetical protein
MSSESGRIIFYDQRFSGTDLPEVGNNASEETRVRASPYGIYELHFRQQPQYDLSGAFLFNEEGSDTNRDESGHQFEIVEDIAGIERTMMIRSVGNRININSVEIVPLDWKGVPLEFTPLEVSDRQRTIRYAKDPPHESLKLKVSGLNVLEVETVDTPLSVDGRSFSPERVATFISRPEEIWIDRLNNPGAGKRRIEEHLSAFVKLALDNYPERRFDFSCAYRMRLSEGLYTSLPVMPPQSLTLKDSNQLFSSLLPFLNNWHESTSPGKGVFAFGVKIYGTASRAAVPVLNFTTLCLPIESIEGWKEKNVS